MRLIVFVILIMEMNDLGVKELRKQFLCDLRVYDGFWNIVESELNGYLRRILKVTAAGCSQTLPEQSEPGSEIDRLCDSNHGNERFRYQRAKKTIFRSFACI